MKKIFNFFILMVLTNVIFAQEFLTPLSYNPYLMNLKKTQIKKATKSINVLQLPVVMDFANHYGYPPSRYFTDSTAFCNNEYSYYPFTNGVITLDALDKYGKIYEHAQYTPFPADSLTSCYIRLDSFFVGVPHRLHISDSIYFSFAFQPQGLGDAPETKDSLILEFYDNINNIWHKIWSSEGMTLQSFTDSFGKPWKVVMIPILDDYYLNSHFRFRFRNYASIADNQIPNWNSNGDIWNIDYVIINKNRHWDDTLPVDLAFRGQKYSLLKNYVSMPWKQFLANANAEMTTSFSIPYSNYSNQTCNVTEYIKIIDKAGIGTPYSPSLSALNVLPFSDTNFIRNSLPYIFNTDSDSIAEFIVTFAINTATIPDTIHQNDTISFIQKFYNYFAYDCGIPTAGYGLSGYNAKLAYKFKLNSPDTLRSIQIFFNPLSSMVDYDYFSLAVWNDINGKPGNIIYQEDKLLPQNTDDLGKFYNYILDQPLALSSGIFYIGFEQYQNININIGFDMNNDAHQNIFYNVDGTWKNSQYSGALMMRPIIGKSPYPYISSVFSDQSISDISIYPNPVSVNSNIHISAPSLNGWQLFDIHGKLISTGNNNYLSIDYPGIYILRINNTYSFKIVVY
jgi:hypothetical protein